MWLHLFLLLLVQLFARAVGDAADQSGEVNCDNSTIIRGLWDAKEPVGVSLCGVYKKGPAYNRLAYRMPPFLSKLIDWLIRDREEIAEKYGADSLEELEHIVENIRKMKNEVETNQPLTPLPLAHSEADRDIEEWNNYLEARREIEGPNLSWYLTRFLLSETYHYRRIIQEFAVTKYLKNFDPYEKQKRSIFENSIMSSAILARETMRELNGSTKAWNEEEKSRELAKFLKLSLWGNRLDLAESGGNDVSQAGDPIKMLNSLEEDLLVDDTRVVWDILKKPQGSNDSVIVDIVLDNAGYELFTDLCLASFLVTRGLASKVRFYVKEIPWYVSDVTLHDFYWIIEYMRNSSVPDLKEFGDLCVLQLERGDWTVVVDPFWTTFYDFGAMKKQAPALYEKLSEATLVIFKGDLNYRKLLGDINWEYTTSLDLVLFHQDFKPSNVVTLRTVKTSMNVGLTPEKIQKWRKKKIDIFNGKYGVAVATSNVSCVYADNR